MFGRKKRAPRTVHVSHSAAARGCNSVPRGCPATASPELMTFIRGGPRVFRFCAARRIALSPGRSRTVSESQQLKQKDRNPPPGLRSTTASLSSTLFPSNRDLSPPLSLSLSLCAIDIRRELRSARSGQNYIRLQASHPPVLPSFVETTTLRFGIDLGFGSRLPLTKVHVARERRKFPMLSKQLQRVNTGTESDYVRCGVWNDFRGTYICKSYR